MVARTNRIKGPLLRSSSRTLLPALGFLVAAALWTSAAAALGPHRLPSISTVGSRLFPLLWESDVLKFQGGGVKGIHPHLIHTIVYTVLGATLGISLGVMTGLAMARWTVFRGLTEVPMEILRTIPPLAAVPFLVIWIGPGIQSEMLLVTFYVAVMMVVVTLNAQQNVDPVYPRYAATLGAGRNRIFRTVLLPAMVPGLVGGIRVALGVAWGIQIVGEMFAGSEGMGQVFLRMISFQALDDIVVGIVWITTAAFVIDALWVKVARRMTRWMPIEAEADKAR